MKILNEIIVTKQNRDFFMQVKSDLAAEVNQLGLTSELEISTYIRKNVESAMQGRLVISKDLFSSFTRDYFKEA